MSRNPMFRAVTQEMADLAARENGAGSWKLPVYGVLLLLLVILAFSSFFTVRQYERAVVTTWGKFSHVAEPGLNFKIPFVQSVTDFRVDIRNLTIAPDDKGVVHGVNTYTVDNQEVDVIFNLFYRLPPTNVAFVYENARDYHERLFNMAVDRIKSEFGKINVEELAKQRGEIRGKIQGVLANDAKILGVEITDFQLPNIEYTKSFRAAVEAAAAAKAMVETRDQELNQARKVAETQRVQAQGQADARVTQAQAEAKAIEMQGEAQAKAIRAQAEALAQNSRLVELRKAEKWDGKLPSQLLSGVVPFMNFQAPKE